MKKILVPIIISIIATGLLLSDYVFFTRSTQQFQDDEHVPGIYKAFHYMSAVRSYPESDIPESGYMKAYEKASKTMLKSSRSDNEWEPIGPMNIGGRTLDIALNPQNLNTIFAASASGGLWKSYTGGLGEDVWERVAIGYPALAIASVEISPVDSNIILIGTGECYGYGEYFPSVSFRATRGLSGMGLLRSLDGGQTWDKSIDWSYQQQRGVQRIKFDPDNPEIIWAATTEGTYKSNDVGETWDLVHDVAMATDIAINPEDPDLVFVACGGMFSEGNGIYRTQDGGMTWDLMDMGSGGPDSFGGKARLCIAPSSPNIIFASIGMSQSYGSQATWLCKSENSGDDWSVVNTSDYSRFQGWYSHYVGVSPADPSKLFCGGVDLWQSANGGATLQIDQGNIGDWFHPDWLHSDHHDIEFHPEDPDIIYLAHDGGVHRTDDGGDTFYSCNWGYQTSQFYGGFSCSNEDSLFAMGGLQDNFSCIWDGEDYWRRVIGGDGSHSAINQENNNIIYGSYQGLSIRKSNDKGISFFNVAPNNQYNVNFIAPFVLSPVDNLTMYGGAAVIYKSVNGASSWVGTNSSASFFNNPVLSMDISSTNTQVVYAATVPWYTRTYVYKTISGGSEWLNITGELPDRYPTDIHVDVNDHDIVYITLGGFGTSHLFKTTDGGDTWESIGEGLPDIPGWSVISDPEFPDHIYYGNEFGVYASTNGGITWEEFNEGLIDAVFGMDLKISMSDRKLRVATHGNGAWQRPLIGSTVSTEDDLVKNEEILLKNFPNPFKDNTTISYSLTNSEFVTLTIYDLTGRKVIEMVNEVQNAGAYEIAWNASDDKGNRLPEGIYICTLLAGNRSYSTKVQILK